MTPVRANPDPVTLDQTAVEAFAGVSAKTLERLAKAGEPVGRLKVGRRVLYHTATLRAWLAAQTARPATQE